jgi:hypothetical protein
MEMEPMAIVTEISWDDMFDGKSVPDNPARKAWREAVAEIADKAKAKLPECSGRVESAVKIVLAGDVELQVDGTANVASQSNGSTAYHVVNGHCDCKDFAKAPHQFCKHRLSAAIVRRAQESTKQRLEQLDSASNGTSEPPAEQVQVAAKAEAPALPEAPVSITLKATLNGHEVMVTLRGTDFASVKTQVEQASEWLSVQGTGQPSHQDDSPYCPIHRVPLKQQRKDGHTWYSHWVADEKRWCKGK